jgi:hypothetical protein
VRDAIDGVRALLEILERRVPSEVRPLRDALSQLQMAYAREVQAGGGAPATESGGEAGQGGAQSPPAGGGPGSPGGAPGAPGGPAPGKDSGQGPAPGDQGQPGPCPAAEPPGGALSRRELGWEAVVDADWQARRIRGDPASRRPTR